MTRPGLIGAVLALLIVVGAPLPAAAVQPDEVLDDPKLEQRARELSTELRCMVCQNESIDASNAPLARDIRVLLRERLEEGDSDEEVIDYLVARYGEFILLKPRFAVHTLLLWLTPVVVLALGGVLAVVNLRKRRAAAAPPLSEREEAALRDILSEERS
ncbi:cytochrome c-type biogenesis protein [Amorphus orientalis]|uniref:Cytochrome c-type biogenesis protein n=1 Tax=Amorphus orientalis TaxID=649198 RepID=A0AAE4ATN0_9HYPH|nr:cytochrome c-type biogenesis protein [Amorphus orientalis]MDQ0315134.1 cytochrome c-type biogenesis protein CcmH [Amorphus orientalis]